MNRGQFVISLDFELMWGMRDHVTTAEYGDAVLGGRDAIPGMLQTFAAYGVRATWATVGFLFAANRRELRSMLPDIRPAYRDTHLDPYRTIDAIGEDEQDAPCWYGRSLIDQIAKTPGQEIATHSFSHYCALEPERDDAAYRADLDTAVSVAGRAGLDTRSIVFARNQFAARDIETARAAGISVYRGNPLHSIYRPAGKSGQRFDVRARRLVDAILPTGIDTGWQMHEGAQGPYNVPASRFFRPSVNRVFDSLRTRRITDEMTRAARTGRMYHLWWHPHNFGRRTEPMFEALETILAHHARLSDSFGFESLNMGDFADRRLSALPDPC